MYGGSPLAKLLLFFLLSTATVVLGQELPLDISTRLDAARAKAAANCSDYETAETLYQKAVEDGLGSVEPLIRLSILSGNKEQAGRLLLEHRNRLEGVDGALLAVLLEKSALDTSLTLSEPHHFLYYGLILDEQGKAEEAKENLALFLTTGQWGREIAESILMKGLDAVCAMCREQQAQRYGPAPLCHTCFDLQSDPGWIKQAMYAPTHEQRRLLSNLYGEDAFEGFSGRLGDLLPDSMSARSDLLPLQEVPAIVKELGPETLDLYESAALSSSPVRALGVALSSGPFDEQLFYSGSAQSSFRERAGSLPDSIDLSWVLNIAYWCHKLSVRPSPDGISRLDLRVAFDAVMGNPDARLTATAMFVKIKMANAQTSYFEQCLRTRPDDLFLHLVLAYPKDSEFTQEDRERQLRHHLWLIEHYPTTLRSAIWSSGEDDQSSRKLVEAWAAKLESLPNSPEVLGAAASFFAVEENELALLLYQRCHALDPENTEWLERIAHQASLSDNPSTELQNLEKALDASTPEKRGFLLTDLAIAAFEAEEYEKARDSAEELLDLTKTENNWNTGNAHHKAHIVLGLLALREDRIDIAGEHLLESARVDGSPQLNSFGPNMQLAVALLERGQDAIVIEYLELCHKFWKSPSIEDWIQTIRQGETPDFGGNLRY
jgi:hypothetical protein